MKKILTLLAAIVGLVTGVRAADGNTPLTAFEVGKTYYIAAQCYVDGTWKERFLYANSSSTAYKDTPDGDCVYTCCNATASGYVALRSAYGKYFYTGGWSSAANKVEIKTATISGAYTQGAVCLYSGDRYALTRNNGDAMQSGDKSSTEKGFLPKSSIYTPYYKIYDASTYTPRAAVVADGDRVTMSIDKYNGEFTAGNDGGTWFNKWQNYYGNEPSLTLSATRTSNGAAENDMQYSGTNVLVAGGNGATYTLSTSGNYKIVGYSFTIGSPNGSCTLTLSDGSVINVTTSSNDEVSQTLSTPAESCSFRIVTNNNFACTDFKVVLEYFAPPIVANGSGWIGNVNLHAGTLSGGSDTWKTTWTSSYLDPQVTLSCPAANMTTAGNYIKMMTGTAFSATYTLSVSDGWQIDSYSFIATDPTVAITIEFPDGSTTNVASSGTTDVNYLVCEDDVASTTFTLTSSANCGFTCYNFVVNISPIVVDPDYVKKFTVCSTTGTLTRSDGDTGSDWRNIWTPNDGLEGPTVSMSTSKNNVCWDTTNKSFTSVADGWLCFAWGDNSSHVPVAWTASDGYGICGITMTAYNEDTSDMTLTIRGNSYVIPAGGKTYIKYSGPARDVVEWSLAAGDNKCFQARNLTFKLEPYTWHPFTYNEDGVMFLYDGDEYNTVYRIPSLVTIPAGPYQGRIIAFTDYRPGGNDVGIGEVHVHCKYSNDYGTTWGDNVVIAQSEGWQGTYAATGVFRQNTSFGDPASIADRESGEVIVAMCSGNVSYVNGTAEVQQHPIVFRSTDGGATWGNGTEPGQYTDVWEGLRDELNTRTELGKTLSFFIGSGGLTQSRIIKKGSHYRVYGAILERNEKYNATYGAGYVIYSDDLGYTWHILGDVNTPALANGGNEAKAEELPDGSVLISIRKSGGRYYNIFRWNDAERTTGRWDDVATTKSMTAADCNGEILIIPARRVSDGRNMFLALQSVPMASGRSNVGIYYKGLASSADFQTADTFAQNWEGSYKVSSINSAYSTMVLQQDHNIGFLLEEEYVSGHQYSERYANLSISTITDGAYEYADYNDVDLSVYGLANYSVTYNVKWNGTIVETVNHSAYEGTPLPTYTPTVGFMSATGVPTGVYSSANSGNYDINLDWIGPFDYLEAGDTENTATYYYVKLKDACYMAQTATDATSMSSSVTVTAAEPGYMWRFSGDPIAGFQLYDLWGNVLAAPTAMSGTEGSNSYPYAVDPAKVPDGYTTLWQVKESSHQTNGFFLFNVASGYAINLRSPYIAFWTGGYDAGSTFVVETIAAADFNTALTATGVDGVKAGECCSGFYNLSGQRVSAPKHGLYIVGGKKVVVK